MKTKAHLFQWTMILDHFGPCFCMVCTCCIKYVFLMCENKWMLVIVGSLVHFQITWGQGSDLKCDNLVLQQCFGYNCTDLIIVGPDICFRMLGTSCRYPLVGCTAQLSWFVSLFKDLLFQILLMFISSPQFSHFQMYSCWLQFKFSCCGGPWMVASRDHAYS